MEPFGWWIETKDFRWFTTEAHRVNVWKGRKGVRVLTLGVIEEKLESAQPVTSVVKCDHEPDVMRRCKKCGADLTPGSVTRES